MRISGKAVKRISGKADKRIKFLVILCAEGGTKAFYNRLKSWFRKEVHLHIPQLGFSGRRQYFFYIANRSLVTYNKKDDGNSPEIVLDGVVTYS